MYVITYIKELLKYYGKLLTRTGQYRTINDFEKQIHTCHIPVTDKVENYYRTIRSNHAQLDSASPGAGSRKKKKAASISEYAKITAINRKKGKLLVQIAACFEPELIIELGTSLGFSTLYMALGSPHSRILTVEGNRQIAELAEVSFKKLHLQQIRVINELFDDALPDLIGKTTPDTMVFIDGNHTYEATMRYINAFSKAMLIVLDDVRWSDQMIRAWNEIASDRHDVTIIDLFSMGIIFHSKTIRL